MELPTTCANTSAVLLDNTVYIAGGQETPGSTEALHTFWSLDLSLPDAEWEQLDPWLGESKWKQNQGRFTLYYRFETTFAPATTMRLKIEINTREHFSVLGTIRQSFTVDNPWFKGTSGLVV